MPPFPQLGFQAYFILNTSRDLGFWVSISATFGFGIHQSLEDGAGEDPNTRVDIHTVE